MTEIANAGGRPVKVLDADQICQLEALAGVLSMQQIAAYFGMTEKTLRAVQERQPEVFTAYSSGRAKMIAKVSSALLGAIERGDMRAIQFYLKTQAGWTEKHALEVSQAELETDERKWLVEVMSANS